MTEQSYATHAHRPTPTLVAGAFTLTAMMLLIAAWLFDRQTLAAGTVSLSVAVAVLVSMSRTYIVRLQDRIIMLEMKVRCAEVLPAGEEIRLRQLTPKQIVALRFASDDELGELLDRAIREKLPAREIKKAIKNWRSDDLRT